MSQEQIRKRVHSILTGIPIVQLYQILYDESQRQYLSTDTVWYDNSNAVGQPCLENHVIAELITSGDHNGADYIGILSWAFERKRAVRIDKLLPMIDGSADVFAFDKMHTHPNVWRKAEVWHKGIIDVARSVFDSLFYKDGIKHFNVDPLARSKWFNNWDVFIPASFDVVQTPNVYSNAFVARKSVYEDYVTNWLVPFMNALAHTYLAKTECKSYTSLKRKQGVTAEHLYRVTGYPYYTLMPFVCERLFSTYLAFNPHITIKHIA